MFEFSYRRRTKKFYLFTRTFQHRHAISSYIVCNDYSLFSFLFLHNVSQYVTHVYFKYQMFSRVCNYHSLSLWRRYFSFLFFLLLNQVIYTSHLFLLLLYIILHSFSASLKASSKIKMATAALTNYHTVVICADLPETDKYYSIDEIKDLPSTDYWTSEMDKKVDKACCKVQHVISNGPCELCEICLFTNAYLLVFRYIII
jgi:hypothetical protein